MNKFPIWVSKYIELYSDITCQLNKGEIADLCNISRETIFRYFKTNPDKKIEVDRIIYDNIKAQKHIIGTLGMQQLVKKLQSNKVSDKAIQMSLTLSGDYVEQTDSVSRFANMKDTELDSAIQNLLRKAKNTRTKDNIADTTDNT